MSWELSLGIVAGIAAIALLGYLAVKAIGREGKAGAVDKTKREQLEEAVLREDRAKMVGAGPIPLTIPEQLKRLRSLRERLHRRRGQAVPGDDV